MLYSESGPHEGDSSAILNYNYQISSSMSHLIDTFKMISGYEKKYAPISEYIFIYIQPILDDMIHIGTDYERVFDEFEVLLALDIAYQKYSNKRSVWGPIGRFGWKFRGIRTNSPLQQLIDEANQENLEWAPIKAGLFGGSIDDFNNIAKIFSDFVNRFGWM